MNFILYSFLIKALLCCLLFQTLDPVWLCLLWTLALPYSLGQLLCSSQLLTEAATVLPDPSPLLFPYRIWPRACFDPISRTGLLFPSFVSFLTDFLLRRAGTCGSLLTETTPSLQGSSEFPSFLSVLLGPHQLGEGGKNTSLLWSLYSMN